MTKNLKPISKGDFSNPTQDQKKAIKKLEARDGKVVVNNKKDKDKEERIPTFTTYKYSNNGKGNLYESVLIGGQPYFITYNNTSGKVEVYPAITEKFRILKPAEPSEYSYPPYEFESIGELERVCLSSSKENLDTLLSKSESIVSKYNDQDQHKLTSIASDVVWGYFQDRFATTRYEVLTGGVGSGKSALAATYGAIGYRPVNTTNPTAAVIYRLLGNIEPGQCTMILEEAEKIDQIYEMMAILKTGYTRDGKVDRTNPNTLKPEFFNSYCFKIIVAERSPSQDTGKGVIDRSFVHSCFKGYPLYDIKEILNPTNTGGPEHQSLRKELNDFRRELLLYRLFHFKDEIADLDIGIIGRDKELVKPTLQLFQETKSLEKLVETFQTILDLKNRRKATSLHSALLDVTISAISGIGSNNNQPLDGKVELLARDFWAILPDRIPGQLDERKPGEYHSTEFGTLYRRTVGTIMHDNFGVESRHTKNGALYTFDRHTINRLRSQLNGKIIIKNCKGDVVTQVTQDENKTVKKGDVVTQVTQVKEGGTNNSSTNNNEINKEISISEREKGTPLSLSTSLASLDHLPPSLSTSLRSPTSPRNLNEGRTKASCIFCRETDDIYYLSSVHDCREIGK